MKSEESRIPLKHELEHEIPTVIHDPEREMNSLERWLRHALDNPLQFWGAVGVLVVGLAGASLLANGWRPGGETTDDAWLKLEAAKTPTERVEIAKAFPKTPAERWALLQAATEFYSQGFNDLPANKDAALPVLKKALDLFQKVADEAPKDTPQARAAALGVARTYEARNELDKAADWYRKVAETTEWAGTPEAREAARLAALLKKPETVKFYQELYAYKAPEATIPGGGIGGFDFPMSPPSGGTGTGPALPDIFNVPPPPPTTVTPKVEAPTAEPKADSPLTIELEKAAPKSELPGDPFAPAADPAPKSELPGDPFAPAAEPKK